MKILIDTQAFLWLLQGDIRLTKKAKSIFLDTDNELYLSIVSLWEISIKISIGKLKLSRDWWEKMKGEITNNGIQWLPIATEHCIQVIKLPFHHKDPFDRMLVAQAVVEKMKLMSSDQHLAAYSVDCLW